MFARILLGISVLGLVGLFVVPDAQAAGTCAANSFICGDRCCLKTNDCYLHPNGVSRCGNTNAQCPETGQFICSQEGYGATCCPSDGLGCGPTSGCLVQVPGTPLNPPQGGQGTTSTPYGEQGTPGLSTEGAWGRDLGIPTETGVRDYTK